jgi:gliding motility-associated-like protein
VESFEHVKITWSIDDASVSKYRIMRSESETGFNQVAEIEDLSGYRPETFYVDTSANFNAQSYYYRIDVFDSCGKQELSTENISRTIHLSTQKVSGLSIDLDWNAYEGWDEISGYEIYREVDDDPNPTGPLETLSGQVTSFNDDISNLTSGEGRLAYYVKAIEGGTGNRESFSNKATEELETTIRIPNALIPESGIEFKPDLDFIEEGFYEMVIFNKWGQQIFVSNNLENGWNGSYNGEIVPAGAYVYVIKFRNARGETVEKRGTVTVIR